MDSFIQVDPIPRGPAIRQDYGTHPFHGGPPRCPVCKSSKRSQVHFNGGALLHDATLGFHCNRCRVWWQDINKALCYICDSEFSIPSAVSMWHVMSSPNEGFGSCYHINTIQHPFCPDCEQKLNGRNSLRRSRLRKMVLESESNL
jgi:hypothetical protein